MAFSKGKSGNPKGRPKGTTTVPRFADFVGEDEKKKFVEFILDQYMGDMRLALWFGDQLFGRAPQSIDHTTLGEKLPTPILGAATMDVSKDDGPTPNPQTQEALRRGIMPLYVTD